MLLRFALFAAVLCICEQTASALLSRLGNVQQTDSHRRDFLSSRSIGTQPLADEDVETGVLSEELDSVPPPMIQHGSTRVETDPSASRTEQDLSTVDVPLQPDDRPAAAGTNVSAFSPSTSGSDHSPVADFIVAAAEQPGAQSTSAAVPAAAPFTVGSDQNAADSEFDPAAARSMMEPDESTTVTTVVPAAAQNAAEPDQPNAAGAVLSHEVTRIPVRLSPDAARVPVEDAEIDRAAALTGYAKVVSDHMTAAEDSARAAADTIAEAAAVREEYETAMAEVRLHAGEAREAAQAVLAHSSRASEMSNLTVDAILSRLAGGSWAVDIDDAVQDVRSASQGAVGATEAAAAAVDAYRSAEERARRAAEESWRLHQSASLNINATIESGRLAADSVRSPFEFARTAATNAASDDIASDNEAPTSSDFSSSISSGISAPAPSSLSTSSEIPASSRKVTAELSAPLIETPKATSEPSNLSRRQSRADSPMHYDQSAGQDNSSPDVFVRSGEPVVKTDASPASSPYTARLNLLLCLVLLVCFGALLTCWYSRATSRQRSI